MHGPYAIEPKTKEEKSETTTNNGTIIEVLKRTSARYYYRIVIVAVIIITQLNENVSDVIQHPHSGDDLGVSVDNVSLASIIVNQALSSLSTTAATATTTENATERDVPQIPAYIRTTSMVFCITIMLLGVIGNLMVPIVIMKTKDMRNSTNIFLINLSIADLFVLVVCTPTVLVEVNTKPDTWILGHGMCKAVPFVELTVAHASVLTILAISFERYYAICEPLKAGYVCTKTRALMICLAAWAVAAIFTSPVILMAEYRSAEEYLDGSHVPVCLTQASNAWSITFFVMTISAFFLLPLFILIVLYTIIAKNLIAKDGRMVKIRPSKPELSFKARKQVVLMLGAVVFSFFVCLAPFRIFTLWIIIAPDEQVKRKGLEFFYNFLYFSRIMLYLNSAINPILYNLMSSKFRKGFRKLWCSCYILGHQCKRTKNGQITAINAIATATTTTTSVTSHSALCKKLSSSRTFSLDDVKNTTTYTGSIESETHTCSVNTSNDCNGKTVGKNRSLMHQASSQSTNTSLDDDRRDYCLACRCKMAKQRKARVSFSLSSDSNDSCDRPRSNTINGGAMRKKKLKFQYGFDEDRFASINAVAAAAVTAVDLNSISIRENSAIKKIEIEHLPPDEDDQIEQQMIPFLAWKGVPPMLWIAKYTFIEYYDGSIVSVCLTLVDSFWPAFYFVGSITIFFILPFLVLLVLYTVIARHLMNNPGITSHGNRSNVLKYRKQVIFMLGAVVISFFICLLPFRALTLWIIIVPPEAMLQLGVEGYYSLLYFCRILLYINSALNPILYNLMSSKFRDGFLKLLGCKSVVRHKLFMGGTRKGTFHTTSTNLSSSNSGDKRKSGRIKDDSETITASIVLKNGLEDILVIGSDSERSSSISLEAKRNGFAKRKRSTFEDIDEIEEIGSIKLTEDDLDGVATTSNIRKKSCSGAGGGGKEVYFGHQNGRNGCNANQRRRSSSSINANCKTQLLSAMSTKRSESIDSTTDDVDGYPEKHSSIYESRLNYTRNDDRESKLFIQQIGTESFV
ncbi:uncharacterized protein LOC116347100 [Contarinia nasturtii]|uniref:uncharacterized protein LOC116347100 n=1 Tax=Contarinia nasturtii TaxID=265458 RepID=UPI0012D46345|nr:uncharacterized protein LOC116347100 [Contarinia nasturtii]